MIAAALAPVPAAQPLIPTPKPVGVATPIAREIRRRSPIPEIPIEFQWPRESWGLDPKMEFIIPEEEENVDGLIDEADYPEWDFETDD